MFSEALHLELDLAIKKDRFQISGASIKNFQINLYSYGFEAKADFWISSDIGEDKLFPKFTRRDPIEARLSIRGVYNLPKPPPEPLIVNGLVTWKSVREVAFEKVIDHLNGKIDAESVPSLVFRRKRKIIRNNLAQPIDVNSLPFLSYDLYDAHPQTLKSLSCEPGRGCPFKCTFCTTTSFWENSYRVKTIQLYSWK